MNTKMRSTPALLAFLCLLAGSPAAAEPSASPNIILIVADDLGFSDLGCYGGEIRTPHLDQLAAEGLRLTQFYNNAVCNITRAAMITGVNPRFGKGGLLRPNMATMAELLRQAGYATAMSGKWHLGGHPTRPIDRGFNEYYGVMIGAVNYFDPTLPDPPPLKHAGPPEPFVHNGTPVKSVPKDYYATDAFVDHTVGQIRKLSAEKRPFFLHLAFTAPHYPLQAPAEDIARYRGRYRDGYGVLRQERYRRLLELGLLPKDTRLPAPDRKLGDWRYDLEPTEWAALPDKDWESAKMEVYAAMVDRLDQGIGRIMATLKESKIDDNTLIIFFSDNGGCGSNSSESAYKAYKEGQQIGGKDSYILCGPGWATAQSSPFRRFKTWTYEGGISTPMIARWPGRIKPATISHAVGHVVDLMPTFLEIAGLGYPKQFNGHELIPLEGESLTPILLGGAARPDREQGWYLYGSRAYRAGKWKVVWGVTAKRWELYDIEADRTETRDLAADFPAVVANLTAAWEKWAQRSGVAP
jgi:arylsulfatase A-like enzyme